MNQIKMSLVDNDYVVQAKTDIDVNAKQNKDLLTFFSRLKEELVIGGTESLTVEGIHEKPISFRISIME